MKIITHIFRLLVTMLLSASLVFGAAAPGDIKMSQRNAAGNAFPDVIFATAPNSLIGTNSAGVVGRVGLGANMTLSGGILNSIAGGAATTNASLLTSGTLAAARLPAFSGGDATATSGTGNIVLNTVNGTVGTYGDSTHVAQFTVNGKGLITSVVSVAIAATGSGNVTGPGSSTANAIATWNGTSGTSIKNTGVAIDGSNNVVTAGNITANVGTFTTGNYTDINTVNLTISGAINGVIGGVNGGTGIANTGKTITLGGNVTMSGSFPFVGTVTGSTGVTFPTTGTLATLAGSEALTNKTLNGMTVTSTNGTLTLANSSTLATSGANSITFTSTGSTNITLPTTGTVSTLAGSESLTNKKLGSLTTNGVVTVGGGDGTLSSVAPGTSGNVLMSNGTAWTSAAATGGGGSTLAMTATLGTDDTYTGATLAGMNAGATIAQWEAVYLGGSSTWLLANATATVHPARGVAVAAYSNTDPAVILVQGPVRNDAWNWTIGGDIYLSTTGGALTQTAPNGSTNIVQWCGYALTADIAYFDFKTGVYVTVP